MIKDTLQNIDNCMNEIKPKNYDKICELINKIIPSHLGYSCKNIYYKGYFQGIQILISGRKNLHILPSKDKVYCTNEINFLI